MKVKIIKGHGWYKELVGWSFEVGKLQNTRLHPYYNLTNHSDFFIEKEHCEIIEEQKE